MSRPGGSPKGRAARARLTGAHHPEVVAQEEMPPTMQLRIPSQAPYGPAHTLSLEHVDSGRAAPSPRCHHRPR
eukprot:1380137-Pyramimonas_sp.AAC.1